MKQTSPPAQIHGQHAGLQPLDNDSSAPTAQWLELACTGADLPAVSSAEIQATYQAAAKTLAYLQEKALPAATRRALRSALRYWSLWHRAAFGEELGLLQVPPKDVPGHRVLAFIAHHSPVVTPKKVDGRMRNVVSTGMPDAVRERLATLAAKSGKGTVGRRRVADRAQRDIRQSMLIDFDVPALKTVQQRVSLLGTLHRNFNLEPPQDVDGRIRPMLSILAKAVKRTVQAALPRSKQALSGEDLQDMLVACKEPGRNLGVLGARDQAMLLASFSSGGRRRSEVAAMEMKHLEPGTVHLGDGQEVDGYWWHLYRLKGQQADMDGKPLLSVPLIGAAAQAMDTWLDLLRNANIKEGPVWRNVYHRRAKGTPNDGAETIGAPIKPEVLAAVVKARAGQALLARDPSLRDADEQDREDAVAHYVSNLAGHSLRSGFTTTQLKAGVHPIDVAKMTGHKTLSSFQIYDQRTVDGNPALSVMMRLQL